MKNLGVKYNGGPRSRRTDRQQRYRSPKGLSVRRNNVKNPWIFVGVAGYLFQGRGIVGFDDLRPGVVDGAHEWEKE